MTWNFALARELIHALIMKFYFMQHALLEHDDLISSKSFVTFHDDFRRFPSLIFFYRKSLFIFVFEQVLTFLIFQAIFINHFRTN